MTIRCVCCMWAGALVLLAGSGSLAAEQKLWKPVADGVYQQEIGEKVATAKPVTAVAVYKDHLYAVVDGQVKTLADAALQDIAKAPKGVTLLRTLEDALWAVAESGTYRFSGDAWKQMSKTPFVDLCLHAGKVHAATKDAVFRLDGDAFVDIKPKDGYLSNDSTFLMEDGSQLLADPIRIGPIQRIASYSGTLYLLEQDGGVGLIDGKTFIPSPIDWGQMPSRSARDLLSRGSCLNIATDRGVAVLRGMALTALRGTDGLPYEDTTCLAAGFDGDLWIGTTCGAIRKIGKEYQYFGADRWLPGDKVNDIAVGDRVVYVATDAGVGIVRYIPFTLQQKAAYYEQCLNDWGMKRLGFIHSLYWSGADNAWLREISDNDGGNTAHYLAALAFKYAATGDEKARQEAVEAFKAMAWLGDICPNTGFIARAIWSVKGDKGERATRGSGGLPAKWYPTPDGLWLWKGDTSSDEIDGHFYAVSIFHDLAARGAEKDKAKEHLARTASHIIDNGFKLRDMDGKPTRWGRWDPEYLLRPYGYESRGLNSMEALAFMQTAFALTGDAKYEQALGQLRKWGYDNFVLRQKLTFPPDSVVPWDDELAFRSYYPLLRCTKDSDSRAIYLRSLERSWEVMRMQHVPFYNFIYGGLTGNDCEIDRAAQHLREWPLDLIDYSFHNSQRCDLGPEPGYVPYQGGTRAMSPRETHGDNSTLDYDGRGAGKSVNAPVCWLEGYWMGRYYGFIQAPEKAAVVATGPKVEHGAAPYNGPPRPEP